MLNRSYRHALRAALALSLAVPLATYASAEQIAVGNYAVSANGMPYAVALEKKFFEAEGIKVDGIISSAGGGTSLRNMLAGGVPYGEVMEVMNLMRAAGYLKVGLVGLEVVSAQ